MPQARALAAAVAAGRDPRDPSPARWPGCARSTRSIRRSGSASSGSDGRRRGAVLTASGGPFLDATRPTRGRDPEQALRHPTWTMGAKITIDSATLANKGLEVIEAHWLYDVGYDAIEVVIHPQSVVHSAVRFATAPSRPSWAPPTCDFPSSTP